MMRLSLFIILFLLMAIINPDKAVGAEVITHNLVFTPFRCDQKVKLIKKLDCKIRSQLAYKDFMKRPMGPWPCSTVNDLLSRLIPLIIININEGTVYNPRLPGKYFPLFDFDRYKINERIDSGAFEFSEDTWETLLGYAGLYIFDDTDQRRHIHDSLALEAQPLYPAIKK